MTPHAPEPAIDPTAGSPSPDAPRRYASRVGDTERADLSKTAVELYVKGASIRKVAAKLQRSYGFTHRLLTTADVPMRRRGGANRRRAG
jgi:hypothetical protein